MSTPKRLMLALASLLLAVATLGLVSTVQTVIQYGVRYGLREALTGFAFLPFYVLAAIPGLLLAAPFVVFFRNAEGWRLWAILGIGIAIGPAFILSVTLIPSGGQLNWQANGFSVVLSLWIGALTTVFYVAFLRTLGRSNPKQPRTSAE